MLSTEARPVVWMVGLSPYEEGFNAYFRGKGPGKGRERCRGWLAAYREEQTELAERAQDRQGRYNVAYGLL